MESLVSFLSAHAALPFAAVLFCYSFVHSDYPLKSACAISSTLYAVCYYLQRQVTAYEDFYPLFLTIDIVWLIMLLGFCAVSRLISGIFAINMAVLSVAPMVFSGHWLFYGLYDYLYLALQPMFVASLTILPVKYPKAFASPYDERDDDRGSFVAFIAGVTSKDFVNFISSRGI